MNEEIRKKARKASKDAMSLQALGVTKEQTDENSLDGENPMDWIDVEQRLRSSLQWNSASLDNLEE